MELHELTSIWKGSDELSEQVKINRKLIKEISMNKIKSQLIEFKIENILELIANILFIIFLVNFIANQYTNLMFCIPAIILFVIAISSLVISGYKLHWFQQINSKYSVLHTQKAIEKLAYFERMDANSLFIIIPVFSLAGMIVAAKAFFEFNLYSLGDLLIYYFVGSLIVGLIIGIIIRIFPEENLKNAKSFLKEINNIENENGL